MIGATAQGASSPGIGTEMERFRQGEQAHTGSVITDIKLELRGVRLVSLVDFVSRLL